MVNPLGLCSARNGPRRHQSHRGIEPVSTQTAQGWKRPNPATSPCATDGWSRRSNPSDCSARPQAITLTMSGEVPHHHHDNPQTGAAPQRSINLKTRPCTVCLHKVQIKTLNALSRVSRATLRGRGEADPKAFAAGGTSDISERDQHTYMAQKAKKNEATPPPWVPTLEI